MKVLVIPEDQELDQYIVKPAVRLMFSEIGVSARVDVLPEPRLRGAAEALDRTIIESAMRKVRFDDLMTCSELRSLFERLKAWRHPGW